MWGAALAALVIVILSGNAGLAGAADGDLDAGFGNAGIVQTRLGIENGHGRAAAALRQPDGKLVVAGWSQFFDLDFTLVRYNADGSLDTTFGGGLGMVTTPFTNAPSSTTGTDLAFAIARQADGKLLAAGSAGVSGNTDLALARYNADGSLDTTFGIGGRVTTSLGGLDDVVSALVVQPDGRLVVAGSSETSLSTRDICLVRYAADGSLDPSFGTGGIVRTSLGTSGTGVPNAAAESLLLQPDGKLVAAGWAGGTGISSTFAVLRYLSDGSLDASFGSGGIASTAIDATAAAKTIIRQSDGKLVAAGYTYATGPGTPEAFALVRYNADGSLDAGFGTAGIVVTQIGQHDIVWGLVQQADGKLLAAGQTAPTYGNPAYDFAVARYLTNGALDTSYGVGGKRTTDIASNDIARAALLQSDGKLIAVGYAYTGWDTIALTRYTTSGALDTTFASAGKLTTVVGRGSDTPAAMVRQPDGKLVVAGTTEGSIYSDFGLARYNADGTLDAGFGSGGKLVASVSSESDLAGALLRQSDGKLVAAGRARVGSNDNFAMARYLANGTADTSFGSAGQVTTAIGTSHDFITAVVEQGDGKLVVAGSYMSNSFDLLALARYNANGTLDSSFGSAGKVLTGNGGTARALALQPDGKLILASGDFSLRRYLSNGSVDSSFGSFGIARADFPGVNEASYGLTVQPDGKLVLVGTARVTSANYDLALARFNPDGSLDPTFGSGGMRSTTVGPGQEWAEAVAYQADGKLAVAGRIMAANGYADVLLARYGADGTLDPTFGSAGIVTTTFGLYHDYAVALLWQPDGKLSAAGVARDAFGSQVFTLLRYAANVCGDGAAAAGEQCDVGAANGADASCCTAACTLRAADHICRPAGGGCDVAEQCDGTNAACPADVNPACTPTATASPTETDAPPPSETPTAIPPTSTATATATETPSASATPTPSETVTPSATATPTPSATATPTPSETSTPSATSTPTPSGTSTSTATPTPSETATPTAAATRTPSSTVTPSQTATPSFTATATETTTPTATATASVTATSTATTTPPATATSSYTATATATMTPTTTATPSATATATPTTSATAAPSITPTATLVPVRCDAAAPQNSCIPGGGSRGSDCVLELETRPVPPLRSGVPKNRATCYEGDPACDSDPDLDDGRCVLGLRLCINNADPRLPSCVASSLHRIEVMRPRTTSTDPADIANLASLAGQAGRAADGFGVTVLDSRRGVISSGVPNATPDLCSPPVPIQIALRRSSSGSLLRQRSVIQLRAHTATVADRDKLTLECRPSSCGDGDLQADHETCDDGNRFNGDGCNQGCQLE